MTDATGTSHQTMNTKIASGVSAATQDLRHVLAEKALQLLDAVDHRQHDPAGALAGEPGRAELGDLVVERRAASPAPGCVPVRDHRARGRPGRAAPRRRDPERRDARVPSRRRRTRAPAAPRGSQTVRCRRQRPQARAEIARRSSRADPRVSCHRRRSKYISADLFFRIGRPRSASSRVRGSSTSTVRCSVGRGVCGEPMLTPLGA